MAETAPIPSLEEFMTLGRLALSDRAQDVQLFLSRLARRYRGTNPELASQIGTMLTASSSRSSALRRESAIPVPVDSDSRLHLIRLEKPIPGMFKPVFAPTVEKEIQDLLLERKNLDKLSSAGLDPTRSSLFVGPPGVGKTLTARWIASELDLPLLILDLSAVMSSFLGRTGNNVRAVLDYAKRQSCVLLLDELDAIAKRRDDATEIGELKRLVTVLLQEIDEWPPHGLLISATNHPELLDPAVWRRFDRVVSFPAPSSREIERAVQAYLGDDVEVAGDWIKVLTGLFRGNNFSDIEKRIVAMRRTATLSEKSLPEVIAEYVSDHIHQLSRSEVIHIAQNLSAIEGMSQRRVSELTGVSRDTLRKRGARSTENSGEEAVNG